MSKPQEEFDLNAPVEDAEEPIAFDLDKEIDENPASYFERHQTSSTQDVKPSAVQTFIGLLIGTGTLLLVIAGAYYTSSAVWDSSSTTEPEDASLYETEKAEPEPELIGIDKEFVDYIRESSQSEQTLQNAEDQISELTDAEILDTGTRFCEKEYTETEAKQQFLTDNNSYDLNEIFVYGSWTYLCEPSPGDYVTDETSEKLFFEYLEDDGITPAEENHESVIETGVAACVALSEGYRNAELFDKANPYDVESIVNLVLVWKSAVDAFCPEYAEEL